MIQSQPMAQHPTNGMEALNAATWVRRESKKLQQDRWLIGSPLEKDLIAHWRQHSPKMVADLEKKNLLEALAFVLMHQMLDQEKAYLKAGMPLTDAREQAERDWLLKEPEDEIAEA